MKREKYGMAAMMLAAMAATGSLPIDEDVINRPIESPKEQNSEDAQEQLTKAEMKRRRKALKLK